MSLCTLLGVILVSLPPFVIFIHVARISVAMLFNSYFIVFSS